MRATATSILGLLLVACQAAAPVTDAPTPVPPTQAGPPTIAPTQSGSEVPLSGLIVFQRTGDGVFTIDARGDAETRILPGEYETPRWSPSGELLALSHVVDDERGIVVPAIARPDGSDVHDLPLSEPDLRCGASVWSPDGVWLAVECWNERVEDKSGLYLMRAADGGELRQLTVGQGIPGGFSNDGTRIVFVDMEGRLTIVGVDGAGERRLGEIVSGLAPGFMPGDASVFASLDGVLTIVDLEGNVVDRVQAPEPKMYEPRLGPDGTTFVFSYDPLKVAAPGLARIGTDGQGFADILLAKTGQAENVSADWRG